MMIDYTTLVENGCPRPDDTRLDVPWRQQAACLGADPTLFFSSAPNDTRAAKQICSRCPVAVQCLAWAIDRPEPEGVWGATAPAERQNLRRRIHRIRKRLKDAQ